MQLTRAVSGVRVQSQCMPHRRNGADDDRRQVRLCEVPAPPFGERARAAVVLDMLRRRRPEERSPRSRGQRRRRAARPRSAAEYRARRPSRHGVPERDEGEGHARAAAMLRGPGIGDNCRGLAVLIAIARALAAGDVQTEGSITLAATVGEEGLGDLRGVRALLRRDAEGTRRWVCGHRRKLESRLQMSLSGVVATVSLFVVPAATVTTISDGPTRPTLWDVRSRAFPTSRYRPGRRRRSMSVASAGEPRSTRSLPRRGWRSTCARRMRRRSRRSTDRSRQMVNDARDAGKRAMEAERRGDGHLREGRRPPCREDRRAIADRPGSHVDFSDAGDGRTLG